MQGLKGIADYCDLQAEVIKERGERLMSIGKSDSHTHMIPIILFEK